MGPQSPVLPAGRQERMGGPNGRFSWARPRGGVPVFHLHSKGYNSVTWLYLTRVGWETDRSTEKESVNVPMVLMIFVSVFQPNACHFNEIDSNFSAFLESCIFFVAD